MTVVLCKSEIFYQLFNSGQTVFQTFTQHDQGPWRQRPKTECFYFHFKTAFSPIFTLLVKRTSHFLRTWGFFGHVKLKCY